MRTLVLAAALLAWGLPGGSARAQERPPRWLDEETAPAFTLGRYTRDLKISPDGKLLLHADRDKIVVRDAGSWQEKGEFSEMKGDSLRGFSPDGKWVIVQGKETEVWDLAAGRRAARLGSGGFPTFSHDGRHVVVSVGRALEVWEAGTWKRKTAFKGHSSNILTYSISPDDRHVISREAGGPPEFDPKTIWPIYPKAKFKRWELETGREDSGWNGTVSLREPYPFFSPDRRYLALSRGREDFNGYWIPDYSLIDWTSPEPAPGSWESRKAVLGREEFCAGFYEWRCEPGAPRPYYGPISGIEFSPGGKLLAAYSHSEARIRVFEAGTLRERWSTRVFGCEDRNITREPVAAVRFSRDERYLAALLGCPNSIRVWDMETGRELRPIVGPRYGDLGRELEFSPDGALLITASNDQLKFWTRPTSEDPRQRLVLLQDQIADFEAHRREKARREKKTLAEKLEEQAAALDPANVKKGEFETAPEFQERLAASAARRKRLLEESAERQRLVERKAAEEIEEKTAPWRRELAELLSREFPYGKSLPLALGSYDADRGVFPATLKYLDDRTRTFDVPVPRAEAPRVKKDGLSAEAHLRYSLQKGKEEFVPAAQLARVRVLDPVLGELAHWSDGEGASASRPAGSGQPRLPPKLSAKVAFSDAGRDGALDAEEKGVVSVSVSNAGRGAAYGVSVSLAPAATPGLRYEARHFVGEIPPGATRTAELPVQALLDAGDGPRSLRVEVGETNGFNAAPVKLTFTAKAFAPPKLVLADSGIKDANGNARAEPGELVDLTLRIRNAGPGKAEGVAVSLGKSDADLFIQGETRAALGDLAPGAFADATFTVFSNTRYARSSMRFQAIVSESRGRYGVNAPMDIPLNKPVSGLQEVVVEAAPGRAAPAAEAPGLKVDVDEDIPSGGAPKPDALAVIFGIERYKKASGVSYARRDAAVFKDYAVKVLGVPDDPGHLFFLDDDVTLGEFKKAFSKGGWLSRRVNADSEVTIYFAGHGAPDVATGGAYLIPQDGDPNYAAETGFPLQELLAFAGSLPARSTTLFLDACFSGADRENKMLLAQARPFALITGAPAAAGKNVLVFSAAKGNQISSGYPEKRHGLFSYFLMKGLGGAADADKDGTLTAGELRDFLRRHVETTAGRLDREQTPELSGDASRVIVRYR